MLRSLKPNSFYKIFNPKSIATSGSNLLTLPRASSESTNSFSWICRIQTPTLNLIVLIKDLTLNLLLLLVLTVFIKDLTLNLLLLLVVTYWHYHVQAPNPQTLSLLDLQNTNSHVCDFEIPFKGFKSPPVDLAATRFHQHLIVDLIPIDTCRVRRHKFSQIS